MEETSAAWWQWGLAMIALLEIAGAFIVLSIGDLMAAWGWKQARDMPWDPDT